MDLHLRAPPRRQRPRPEEGVLHQAFSGNLLIERLAALVPRPRKHLTTYHGVFAPNASFRDRIVPPPPEDGEPSPAFRTCQNRRKADAAVPHAPRPRTRRRYPWAELMLIAASQPSKNGRASLRSARPEPLGRDE